MAKLPLRTSPIRRRSRVANRPRLEALEERVVLDGDIDVTGLTLAGRTATVAYRVVAEGATPFAVGLYRSADATFDPSDLPIGAALVAGSDATPGDHAVAIASPALGIDPSRPYVLAVADPLGQVAETSEANNVAGVRKYVIGAVAHGLEISEGPPQWVQVLAGALKADGYDQAIAFDWSQASNAPLPGQAVLAGQRLAAEVIAAARAAPAGADIDLHLIGQSRGGVVIATAAQAIQDVAQADPSLRGVLAGITRLTFLDPHPAHNVHAVGDPNATYFSASTGPLGQLTTIAYRRFQDVASDPDIVLPSLVDEAEVFHQEADHAADPVLYGKIFNPWGETPIPGASRDCDLNGTVNDHYLVHDWYLANAVPGLRTGQAPACPIPTPLPRRPERQVSGLTFETRLLVPGLVQRRGVAVTLLQRLGSAASAYRRNRDALGDRRLAAASRFVRSQAGRGISLPGALALDVIIGSFRRAMAVPH